MKLLHQEQEININKWGKSLFDRDSSDKEVIARIATVLCVLEKISSKTQKKTLDAFETFQAMVLQKF